MLRANMKTVLRICRKKANQNMKEDDKEPIKKILFPKRKKSKQNTSKNPRYK